MSVNPPQNLPLQIENKESRFSNLDSNMSTAFQVSATIVDLTKEISDICDDTTEVALKDPGSWQINESLKNYFAIYGFEQNINSDFSGRKREYQSANGKTKARYFNQSPFWGRKANGEKEKRDGLIYSTTKSSVYCGPCILFRDGAQFETKPGFHDWKNAYNRLESHENSPTHETNYFAFKNLSNAKNRVDSHLANEAEKKSYWREIILKIISVVRKLTSRGLALRGKKEEFFVHNNGIYMMSLELLAEHDPFLRYHIAKFGNHGSGRPRYLSYTICDEVIKILAKMVRVRIFQEIRDAKYFSIVIDSTPDVSNVDQSTNVIRCNRRNTSRKVYSIFGECWAHGKENGRRRS